jgi:selenocysteine-specific elongation factor
LRAPLGELVREGDLLEVPEGPGHPAAFVSARAYARVAQRARRVLDSYFAKDRLARGIPRAEAVRRILPGRAAALADVYLPWLQKQQVIALQDDLVNRPGRQVELTGEESLLSRAVTERYERAGLDPPPPGDVAVELQAKPQILEGVLRFLVSRGDLVRLPNGLLIARSALDGLRRAVLDSDWERFSVADFKDRFGLSRKWAIPLLEHLDSSGLTRRLGDERMVVRGLS